MPKCEKFFEDYKSIEADPQNKSLDKKLRKYFMRFFRDLIIYFDLDDLNGSNNVLIKMELKSFIVSLNENDRKKEEYTFNGKCAFCMMSNFIYFHRISWSEKLKNPYSNCSVIFGHRFEHGEN